MSKWHSNWRNAAACMAWFSACPPAQTPLSTMLQKMGLYEMRLPKEVWPIGTIVALKMNSFGQLAEVEDVCNPAMMDPTIIGKDKSYEQDPTTSTANLEQESAAGGISMTGVILEDVKASLGVNGHYVSNISIGINNAVVQSADAVTLIKTARLLMAFPDCASQVKSYKADGFQINSLSKVLIADLSYSVEFSDGASSSVKADLLSRMSVQLDASYDKTDNSLVRGHQLTFGFSVPPVSPIEELASRM